MFNSLKQKLTSQGDIPLWTRGYTILTIGSIISYMGNASMSFAMSLLVLDASESVLFYSIYLICYRLFKVVIPMLSGPILDRISRKKAIYTLDFLSAGVYLSYWILFMTGNFEFWMTLAGGVLLGAIDSVYRVAYISLFPMLVHKDNLQKANSIYSMLETMSNVMVPIAGLIYKYMGMKAVLLMGAIIFFAAAVMETKIEVTETNTSTVPQDRSALRRYGEDMKAGWKFVSSQKALLLVTAAYFFIYFKSGVADTVWLPFFKARSENGYFWYLATTGCTMAGSFISSFLLLFLKVPRKKRFYFAMAFSAIGSLMSGMALMVPYLLGCVFAYISGIGSSSHYNLRSSSIYSYLSDEVRSRFSGIFLMVTNIGIISGQFLSGILSEHVPLKYINLGAALLAVCAVLLFYCILGKDHVKKLMNLELVCETKEDPESDT